MKKFQPYINKIGIRTSALKSRINDIYKMHMALNSIEPDDILIEDYIDTDGTRFYTCLNFFFSGHFIFCADNFINKNEFYVSSYDKLFTARFDLNNYSFDKVSDKSAVTIELRMSDDPERGFTFKATRENCNHLMRLYHLYMEPFILKR